jgi:hypothetical protein
VDVGYGFAGSNIRILSQSPFLGFRVDLADGPRYGFAEFDWRIGMFADGGSVPMYQPIRWGYETLPNTPITLVPGVPVAAVMAGVAVPLVLRRRRVDDSWRG